MIYRALAKARRTLRIGGEQSNLSYVGFSRQNFIPDEKITGLQPDKRRLGAPQIATYQKGSEAIGNLVI